ncbi:XkdQ/YqbQ family protein [Veillonella montpellierensis]|uniref:XkdQ/YqbQ family protein n=1 Tax=Veillonella montpellierensis TaxID=187328 RepID=UPI0023F8B7EF|nr:hypothetical protein [Veillonella montpellierensis]
MITLIEHINEKGERVDITHLVSKFTWSGDKEEAARKLEFSYAYNPKDVSFPNYLIALGDHIEVTVDDAKIFNGRVFFRKRNTNDNTYDITCYDGMIYLAKSKVSLVFNATNVVDAFKRVCAEVEIPVGTLPEISTVVNFVADKKTCTEVFQMLFERTKADIQKDYTAVLLSDGINLIEKGTTIEEYIARDTYDVISSSHSESIEDMINRVKTVDAAGNVIRIDNEDELIKKYGVFQDIYKKQPKAKKTSVDNRAKATSKIKGIKMESSISAIGNIQCIAGYSVVIEEEQLKGVFFIKSDTHTFENNTHVMELNLEYIREPKEGEGGSAEEKQ